MTALSVNVNKFALIRNARGAEGMDAWGDERGITRMHDGRRNHEGDIGTGRRERQGNQDKHNHKEVRYSVDWTGGWAAANIYDINREILC